ncbi:MAG: stage II sporulation protein E [Lentisphaerae bacterium RIFOXYB12_FULL_65_16]|nr:MAG: stage II sporulation protein E [Lentisphaerae bacterium RIFOXYA12_64_32]OGV94386.1 MAG: stage II sporulation protein E [Lentisphaerae bacterium RIFOXYB12_FULL_65_16]
MSTPAKTDNDRFLEVDHWQHCKSGQFVAGDVFLSHRIKEEGRVISVLSDGLGSGVKANVLATLTATMATKYIENYTNVSRTAEIIMDTLPVCSVRRISYSTFTIVDVDAANHTRVVEHGNPPYVLLRGGDEVEVPKQLIKLEKWQDRDVLLSEFDARVGDRIVFCSDGVTQAGMGSRNMPLGWGSESVTAHLRELVAKQPTVSAGDMARRLANHAREVDNLEPKDDITAAVIYVRQPRRLLLITGPPFAKDKDAELAARVRDFPGRKIICGGTTAQIVARELKRKVVMSMDELDPEIPPSSSMEGVDLITEGTLTLSRAADIIEKGAGREPMPRNAATMLASALLGSDWIQFVVGTRINEAHQDPNTPVELEIRRTIIARIARVLEEKYLKDTRRRYV